MTLTWFIEQGLVHPLGYNIFMGNSSDSVIRTGGDADLAFGVVVLASYFATFSGMINPSGLEIILMIVLGMSYLSIGIYGYGYCARSKKISLQIVYFLIQIPLGGLIVFLGNGAGFNALVLLPLAGHAVVLLPRKMSYAAQLLIASSYILAVYAYGGGFQAVWSGLPTFMAGLIFVVVFTQMTLNEETSRREVEDLLSQLTIANQHLRDYALQVEDLATMKERNRLAREIHDGLGHYLTTINMQIQAAMAINTVDSKKSAEMLTKAQALTQEALADVRQSVSALRSSPNEIESLSGQITNLFHNLTMFKIQGDLTIVGQERLLDFPYHWALYRAAQEGISNACKHSKAQHLWIKLDYSSDEWVRMEVKDDGKGAQIVKGGFGLVGLRERITHLGGIVEIFSMNGKGFTFEVKIPG